MSTQKKSIKNNNFKYGVVNSVESQSIKRGAFASALNFITQGDRFELRRGSRLLGTDVTGNGKITGLHTAVKADGTEILFRTRGQKLEYYDTVTEDWLETGTNELGADADGEEISMEDYNTTAGAMMYIGSPKLGIKKIMLANPGSITSLYDASKNFKGFIRIKQNRTFLWGRDEDKTGLYGSYVDSLNSTVVSAEVLGVGDGVETDFSGTLAFKAVNAWRTCFGITATGTLNNDAAETFTDDFNGILTGNLGGTGTINYTTGAITLNFAYAIKNATNVTVTYNWENSNDGGITDFTKSATRLAGEGFIFRQDDGGGDIKNVFSFGNVEYCMHRMKTWALELTSDDTNANNNIYRKRVGIPSFQGGVETGDGIYYIDDKDTNDPKVRLLTFSSGSSEVIPSERSVSLDISDLRFDKACMQEFGDYIILACRTLNSTENNRTLFYNKAWKSWDYLDYYANKFAIYGGALHVGDSISNNVYEMLSGLDDDDSDIIGEAISNKDDLDYEGMKKCKELIINGRIGSEQEIDVFASIDGGTFVLTGTITGNGSYVDSGNSINVGAVVVGKNEVGGGGDGISAFNYWKQIKLNLDQFYWIQFKFVTKGLGWFDISSIEYRDIRSKRLKLPNIYRA